MSLSSLQRSIVKVLNAEWQSPSQIAGLLQESGSLSDINLSLQDLLQQKLVQANPVVLGLYRLTELGITVRETELREN